MSAGSPVQPVLKKVLFTKRCAPRFHAECTGHCVESFHEEPIREKNVIFKKVASWYPGIPGGRNLIHENNIFPGGGFRFSAEVNPGGHYYEIRSILIRLLWRS